MENNNIAKKLVEVMKDAAYVQKNGRNGFHGYSYATASDVLSKINESLTKHNISCCVLPELISMDNVVTAKGNKEHLATVKVTIMLTDADSGQVATLTGLGSGQDSGDKAIMKAQTAAIKYAFMLSLCISTGDDPEADTRTDESTFGKRSNTFASPEHEDSGPKFEDIPNMHLDTCSVCGRKISPKVKKFSESRYGRALCMDCQKVQMQKGSA